MSISEEQFEAANSRATALKAKTPHALAARYDRRSGRVVVELSTGLHISFSPNDAQGLQGATPRALSSVEISPSGLGLHFPALDADLYLPSLLEGFLGSRRWMAAHLGRAGGGQTSEAKAAAARANGQLGGRPKKLPPNPSPEPVAKSLPPSKRVKAGVVLKRANQNITD